MTNAGVAMNALGWFGLGLSAGLLMALLVGRRGQAFLSAIHPWLLRGSLAVLAALSIALLSFQPEDAPTTAALGSAAESRAMTGEAAPAAAGSMEAATAILSARLGAKGGSDADWTLLAQSYDFLGRSADAELARQHKVPAQRSLQDSMAASASMLGAAKSSSSTSPGAAPANGTVAALLAKAEEHRRKREFKQACDVYRSVVASGGMTADAWADYADALASSSPSGSLSGEPAAAIAKALSLDPRHTKALWLNASLAHEEHRYQDALAAWRTLLALIPPGSSDARIVEANIAEATRLAGVKAGSRG
jgi:cytochrome c-type biogenesis protein CcmH/NrfG